MPRRKAYLHKNGLGGTDGSIYSSTKEGLTQMVASLKSYLRTMDDLEMDTNSVNLKLRQNKKRW